MMFLPEHSQHSGHKIKTCSLSPKSLRSSGDIDVPRKEHSTQKCFNTAETLEHREAPASAWGWGASRGGSIGAGSQRETKAVSR